MEIRCPSRDTTLNSLSMKEEIDIEKEGKDIIIGFNPKFLIDALRVIDDENVTIYMVNPKAPSGSYNSDNSEDSWIL